MHQILWVAAFAAALHGTAWAADAPSFKGKTITIIVGFTAGGSTDIPARLIAPYLTKYLPGAPDAVVQNMPGAGGMTAMNHMAQRAAPNGLTATMGSNTQLDPINYRVPQSKYDPSKFPMVGGVDVGGSFMIVRRDALARLNDRNAKPVIMASVGGFPRSGMQMAGWGVGYLGWNAKWVSGYPGSAELIMALGTGEIDMTSLSLSNAGVSQIVLDKKTYEVIYQTGMNAATVPTTFTPLAAVPLFAKAMEGKIADPVAQKAFDYWRNVSSISKWLGLPPGTPEAVVVAYRAAFKKAAETPAFREQLRKVSEDIAIMTAEDLTQNVLSLAETPPEALAYMTQLLQKQGLKVVSQVKKKKSN